MTWTILNHSIFKVIKIFSLRAIMESQPQNKLCEKLWGLVLNSIFNIFGKKINIGCKLFITTLQPLDWGLSIQ